MVEKGKSAFVGPEILGKKLGVIGLGAIGILVANAAAALGMEVYGYDPYLSVDAAWGLSRSIHHATDLDEIYAQLRLHHRSCAAQRRHTGHDQRKDASPTMKDGRAHAELRPRRAGEHRRHE